MTDPDCEQQPKLQQKMPSASTHPWMDFDSTLKGMVCTVCMAYGKVPVQASWRMGDMTC